MAEYITLPEYADLSGLAAKILAATPDEPDKRAAIRQASALVDEALNLKEPLDPLELPEALKLRIAFDTDYLIMTRRGFDPTVGSNQIILSRWSDNRAYYERLQKGDAAVAGLSPSGAAASSYLSGPSVISSPRRGW